jgi:hypothetical protein
VIGYFVQTQLLGENIILQNQRTNNLREDVFLLTVGKLMQQDSGAVEDEVVIE